jgi:protein-tyrosine phosphatase
MRIKKILFVCLGNTARSPAAEFLARHYAKMYGIDLLVQSAGFINAFSYMQPESQEYLNEKGINNSDFRPQLINRNLLGNQDLIITMEQSHVDDIVKKYSELENINNITFTLKEFNGESYDLDIIDPYYTSKAMYQNVLKTIDENVEKLIKKVKEINMNYD